MSGNPADVAGRGTRDLDALDPLEEIDLPRLASLDDRPVGTHGGELRQVREIAGMDPSDGEPAQIIRVIDVGDEHLERRIAHDRGRDPLQDLIEEGPQITGGCLPVLRREP